MERTVFCDIDDRVATITLNRPGRMNAMDFDMTESILEHMRNLDARDDVRVIVLTGAGGKAFSSGHDLRNVRQASELSVEQIQERYAYVHSLSMSPLRCSKPVIAMIDGYCLAGAFELALCCDLRYCSDRSRIGVLEGRFGGSIVTWILPWIVGNQGRELVYTGDMLSGNDALQIGLVNRVFPTDRLREETMRIAHRVSRVPLETLKNNKRTFNRSMDLMGLHAGLENGLDAALLMRIAGSPERRKFDEIKDARGIKEALAWRKSLFAPFETPST